MKRFLAPAVAATAFAFAASAAAMVDPASGATIALAPDASMHRAVAACTGDSFALFDGSSGKPTATVAMRCGRGGPARVSAGIAITGEDASGPALAIVRDDGSIAARTSIDRAPVGRPVPSPDGAVVALISGSGALYLASPSGALVATIANAAPAATDAREAWRGSEGAWCWSGAGYVFAVATASGVASYDAAGKATTAYAGGAGRASAKPTCADLDGDGADELLWPSGGAVTAIDASGAARWTAALPAAAPIEAPIAVASTANGPRVVAVNDVGWLAAIDARGAIADGFPRRVPARVRVEPLLADVDGDAAIDVVVTDASGSLAAFALDDGRATIDRAPWTRGGWLATTPVIADANGDGLAELIAIDATGAYLARPLPPTALSLEQSAPWPGAGGSLDGASSHALSGGPRPAPAPRPASFVPIASAPATGSASSPTDPSASSAGASTAPSAACGCTAAGSGTHGGSFATLLLALVALARRRARS